MIFKYLRRSYIINIILKSIKKVEKIFPIILISSFKFNKNLFIVYHMRET